jgi:rare lipoprotein A
MIERARRAFPGMVVSMLIAAPALSTGAHAAEPATRKPVPSIEQRKASLHHRPVRAYAARQPLAGNTDSTIAAYVGTGGSAGSPVWNQDGTTWRQTGMASWYGGSRWHGQRTSSGERYDQNALTAAHATLPLGSKVRVTLAGSDRSVIVTINDRPGTRRRIIDLSRGAAAELGILSRGVAVVTLAAL